MKNIFDKGGELFNNAKNYVSNVFSKGNSVFSNIKSALNNAKAKLNKVAGTNFAEDGATITDEEWQLFKELVTRQDPDFINKATADPDHAAEYINTLAEAESLTEEQWDFLKNLNFDGLKGLADKGKDMVAGALNNGKSFLNFAEEPLSPQEQELIADLIKADASLSASANNSATIDAADSDSSKTKSPSTTVRAQLQKGLYH